MWNGKKIAVIVPAYNESKYVVETLETIPKWVDLIYAVNDKSTDATLELMKKCELRDNRITVIDHEVNTGVGGSIISGYKAALNNHADICCVMAGDGQMDPVHLHELVDPVSKNLCDMAKGNRFHSLKSLKGMPLARLVGSLVLTFLTRIASGLYRIWDPQNGYVAVSADFLHRVPLKKVAQRYDFENDFLCWAGLKRAKVMDLPINARYRDETSTLNIANTAPRIFKTLLRGFSRRFLRINDR
jgi:glycosyltransferase involved in cell wall biosynthesis